MIDINAVVSEKPGIRAIFLASQSEVYLKELSLDRSRSDPFHEAYGHQMNCSLRALGDAGLERPGSPLHLTNFVLVKNC
jgi:hypothetical protein